MTADLITRLESADGPDRELFEAAWNVVHGDRDYGLKLAGADFGQWFGKRARYHRMLDAEAWTSAAEMLVPEGWSYVLRPGFAEMRHPRNPHEDTDGHAKTTALALAAAALKARGV